MTSLRHSAVLMLVYLALAKAGTARVGSDNFGNVQMIPALGASCFCGSVDLAALASRTSALETLTSSMMASITDLQSSVQALVKALTLPTAANPAALVDISTILVRFFAMIQFILTSNQASTDSLASNVSLLQATAQTQRQLNDNFTSQIVTLQNESAQLSINASSINKTVAQQQAWTAQIASSVSLLNSTVQSSIALFGVSFTQLQTSTFQSSLTFNSDIVISSVDTSYDYDNPYVTSLTSINGGLFIGTAALTTISLPFLTFVSRWIELSNNQLLTFVAAPQLSMVGDILRFLNNPKMTFLSFPALTWVKGINIAANSGLASISFPFLTYIGSNGLRFCGNNNIYTVPANILNVAKNMTANTQGCMISDNFCPPQWSPC